MVMKFIYGLWEKAGTPVSFIGERFRWDAADSRARTERRSRDEQERVRRSAERQEREDRKDRQEFGEIVIVSEISRQAAQDLLADIEDAMNAARDAYERLLAEQETAQIALAEVQARAIVLADGRRVYWSELDGVFYTEDGAALTDPADVSDARRKYEAKPGAATIEEFTRRRDHHDEITKQLEEVGRALDRLDDLRNKVREGKATDAEITAAREELNRILQTLPEDIRKDYDQRRVGRVDAGEPAHVAPALSGAPDMNTHFADVRAATAALREASEDPELAGEADRDVVYVDIPKF